MSDLFEAPRLFITNTGSLSRLDVGGELDVATASALHDHLELLVESGTGDIDVDMARVTFCDATTLTVLVAAHHRLAIADRHLKVINASRPVVRLLELTDLDTLLLEPPDETDAPANNPPCYRWARTRIRPHRDGDTYEIGPLPGRSKSA